MAAAISPADRTLNPVISVSPLDTEAKHFGVCFGNEWSDRRFKLNIFSWSFTGARSAEETITNSGPRLSRAVARERAIGG
jgi:hypothetical protein